VAERQAVPAATAAATATDVSAARAIVVLAGPPDGARALLGEAAALAARVGGRVLAVVPADPDITRLASWGADELIVLGADAPRPVAAALASWIEGHAMPWAILGSVRSWDREVLGRLAVLLGAGLMSDLVQLYARAEGDGPARIVGAKPSGNTSVAEIVGHGPTQIATVRTGCLDLRAPRAGTAHLPIRFLHVAPEPAVSVGPRRPDPDYDALERAEVVIGVGRGVDPAHYDELLPLCARLGAELAATRKVTDAGRLPHSRQVGITARDIAPRLYIAVGLLGNRNHMAGVARAGTVLAINADPAAPVFTQCDIGIVADWREAVPRLVAELERRGHARAPARPCTTAGVAT
jgi:electron transfer flavoprotein alpha subunit